MFYTKRDLSRMGKEASFNLFSQKVPLLDSVVKVAEDKDLNQEQIKRVCHAANTETMLQIYGSPSDNTKHFDTVDYKEVIAATKGQEKTASDKHEPVSSDYAISMDKHLIKLAHKVDATAVKRLPKWKIEADLRAMRKTASRDMVKLSWAKGEAKAKFFKYAGALDRLADAIISASKKGITNDSMLQAALRTGDNPNIVRKAFEQALDLAKKKKPGILSRIWGGIKSFFKTASDGSMEVDSEYISEKLKEANGNIPVSINKEHPFVKALEDAFTTREELRAANVGTSTVEEAADLSAGKVRELELKLKGCK